MQEQQGQFSAVCIIIHLEEGEARIMTERERGRDEDDPMEKILIVFAAASIDSKFRRAVDHACTELCACD